MPRATKLGSQLLVASPQDGVTNLSSLGIRSVVGKVRFGQELLGRERDKGRMNRKGDKEKELETELHRFLHISKLKQNTNQDYWHRPVLRQKN